MTEGRRPGADRGDLGASLLPHHSDLIAASGISDEVACARGYRSVIVKAELTPLGFGASQRSVPGLLIPIHDVHGEIVLYQYRPDSPRLRQGKPIKYETPGGARMDMDVPPAVRESLADPRVPLWITEGARKADAAVSAGLCCIALLGVWNWRGTNKLGGKTALAAWESIALNGREVVVAFDSDVVTKQEVRAALQRLARFLESRGAIVRVARLPAMPDGRKTGLDDYLASGRIVQDLLATCEPVAAFESSFAPVPLTDGPYTLDERGIWFVKKTADGDVWVQLCNFPCEIVASIEKDDGLETSILLKLEATVFRRKIRFTVSASAFPSMNWVLAELGPQAIVCAGQATKDRIREAIQRLSPDPPRLRVYTHTGWRNIDGGWVYLSGPVDGADSGPTASLEGALAGFRLPAAPTVGALRKAVDEYVALLDLAPDHVSVPLFVAPFLAVLGKCDFALFLVGPTGSFKSELAAICQQFFGASMDARHLPGNWSSTENSLEELAFGAKDALLVVDDFAPGGASRDVQRLHAKAERLFRAQGNHSGRGRMNADGRLRKARPPRCLILATGEDLPAGASIRARIVGLEVRFGDVPTPLLTRAQTAARDGVFAGVLSAFVRWLARRYGEVSASLNREIEALRVPVEGGHGRTPDAIARLQVALDYVLRFLVEEAGVPQSQAREMLRRGSEALIEAACRQLDHQKSADPALRFVELVRSAFASGRAHAASPNGCAPDCCGAWGWRSDRFEPSPCGERIGWVIGNDLYLEPDAALRAARTVAGDGPDGISVSGRALQRLLRERKLLASTDHGRESTTVRRVLESQRRNVLHFDARRFWPEETDQSDQGLPRGLPDAYQPGRFDGRFDADRLAQTDHRSDHDLASRGPRVDSPTNHLESDGRIGRVLAGGERSRDAAPRDLFEEPE